MSTNVNHYILFGINLKNEPELIQKFKEDYLKNNPDIEYSDDLYDVFEPYMKKDSEWNCIFDGMSMKSILFGKLINIGDQYEGMNLKETSFEELSLFGKQLTEYIKIKFNYVIEPKLFSLSLWS